jgi:hypothetical protein
MQNQKQYFRQTITVLMACGLIASLLPGFAAAQDLSTREKRAAWLFGQYDGITKGLGNNAKHGAARALARLALNPDDAYVINKITHFYDKVREGENGEQFTYFGVAMVLGKYWDKFTPAQRDHLKAKIKGFDNLLKGGTENHAIMKNVGAYLWAQYWPNETGWLRGTHTSAQIMAEARKNLLAVMRSLYDKGYVENLSTTYAAVHLGPYYALYSCATDPGMKAAANAALHFHIANAAANHFEGVVIPPANRWNVWQTNTGDSDCGLQWIYWLYWGEKLNRNPVGVDVTTNENSHSVYAAASGWVPPATINSLAWGQTVPYELTASASFFGSWGTGQPAENVRYVYRDKLYAMGTGFFQYRPDGHYDSYNAFGLIYKSPDKYNYIECYHPYWRSNDRTWKGINSPFMQMAQHKGTAIVLFNIPTADPWVGRGRDSWQAMRDAHSDNLIKEALIRYPKSIDQKTEANGWIFLREGGVYIAIRPLKDYAIDTNYKPAGEFDVIVSPGAKNAVVFDIATKQQFATFEVFQGAVGKNPPVVDWNKLSVTYKNVNGDTLAVAWNPPKYDVPKAEENDPERKTVQVRPDIKVNGAVVPIDTDFTNGKAVMKSSSVELVDRVLRLKTSAGELVVDWRGEIPKFSNR